jgi:hypothetical protein
VEDRLEQLSNEKVSIDEDIVILSQRVDVYISDSDDKG